MAQISMGIIRLSGSLLRGNLGPPYKNIAFNMRHLCQLRRIKPNPA